MKNIQINTLRKDWPIVASTTKNVYLCPEIIKEMNKDVFLTKPDNEKLKPYSIEEIDAMIEESERDFEAGMVYTTEEVIEYCKKELEEERAMFIPYTKEELLKMAETGRRQIAEGKCFSTEEVLRYCGYEIPKDKTV